MMESDTAVSDFVWQPLCGEFLERQRSLRRDYNRGVVYEVADRG